MEKVYQTENLRLNYRYRDAHNYKELGNVVFANPAGMSVEVATALLRGKLKRQKAYASTSLSTGVKRLKGWESQP